MSGRHGTFHLDIPGSRDGERIDQVLAEEFPEHSRAYLTRLIEDGRVFVEARAAAHGPDPGEMPIRKPSFHARGGQRIRIEIPKPRPRDIEAEALPLHILYEDDSMMVVDKAAGMVVHPTAHISSGTLVNAVMAHSDQLSDAGGVERLGLVHRLDRETSGVILIAKTDTAHRWLSDQFKSRMIDKVYLAIVKGLVPHDKIRIDSPIGRHPHDRKRMAVVKNGRPSRTDVIVRARYRAHTLVECHPLTGRTHQIRVHLLSVGFPLLGDKMYGGMTTDLDVAMARVALHAHSLTFFHPVSGQSMTLRAELHPDMAGMIEKLEKNLV